MANFMNYDNATTIFTQIGQRLDTLNGALHYRGSISFANIPSTLTKAMEGYTYNIEDDFTTDSRFVEGAGKSYPAGTNISVVNIGTEQTPEMKLDVNGSFVDLSGIENRLDDVVSNFAPAFDETKTYAVGETVIYEDVMYTFKSAHAAGTWNPAEVDLATVIDLINNIEVESFTTSQMTALLALISGS